MSFSNFKNAQPYQHNLNSQHHVIKNNRNFIINRTLVTIHSNDRDYSKYPNGNNFTLKLGREFQNVQSVRLVEYSFPKNLYAFSKKYCNTKLNIYITDSDEGSKTLSDHNFSAADIKAIKSGMNSDDDNIKYKR